MWKTIHSNKKTELCFNKDKNRFFIFKKTNSNSNDDTENRDNFIIHPCVIKEDSGEFYEALEIKYHNNDKIVSSLYKFISSFQGSIRNSIKEIENLLKNKILDDKYLRGLFAELYALSKNSGFIVNNDNSIYDFSLDGIDWEIKSFSSSDPIIHVSKQQAINSKKANFWCFEVFESLEGLSIKELMKKNAINHIRYNWIFNINDKNIDKKFKIGKDIILNINKYFNSVVLPQIVEDAIFKININSVEKNKL